VVQQKANILLQQNLNTRKKPLLHLLDKSIYMSDNEYNKIFRKMEKAGLYQAGDLP
jgi:hypothetical protein